MAATEGYASALGMASPHSSAKLNLLTHARVLATYGRMDDWIEACLMFGLEEMPPLAGKEISQGLGLPGVTEFNMELVADGEGYWQDGDLPDLIDYEDDNEDELDELSGQGKVQEDLLAEADDFLADNGYDIDGNHVDDEDVIDSDDYITDLWMQEDIEYTASKSDPWKYGTALDQPNRSWKWNRRNQYQTFEPDVPTDEELDEILARQQETPWHERVWLGATYSDRRDSVEQPEVDHLDEGFETFAAWHMAGLPFHELYAWDIEFEIAAHGRNVRGGTDLAILNTRTPVIRGSNNDRGGRKRILCFNDHDNDLDDDSRPRGDIFDGYGESDDLDESRGYYCPICEGCNSVCGGYEDQLLDDDWDDHEDRSWEWQGLDLFWPSKSGRPMRMKWVDHDHLAELAEQVEAYYQALDAKDWDDSDEAVQPWHSWKWRRSTQHYPVVNSVPKRESARHTKAIPISQADDFDDQLFDDLMEIEEAKEAQEKAA